MDELARRFADLTVQYGPHVVEAARAAAQVSGRSTLMGSVIDFAIAVACIALGLVCQSIQRKRDVDPSSSYSYEFPMLPTIAAWGFFGLAGIPFLLGVWVWIDPWTWVAINQPDLWIAHTILKI